LRAAILAVLDADEDEDPLAAGKAAKAQLDVALQEHKQKMGVPAVVSSLLTLAEPIVDTDMVVCALNVLVGDEEGGSSASAGWADTDELREAMLVFLKQTAHGAPETCDDEDVAELVCKLLLNPSHGGFAAQLLGEMPVGHSEVASSKTKKRLVDLATGKAGGDLDPAVCADVVDLIVKRYGARSKPIRTVFSAYMTTLVEVSHE
jgi:hypothetical protein